MLKSLPAVAFAAMLVATTFAQLKAPTAPTKKQVQPTLIPAPTPQPMQVIVQQPFRIVAPPIPPTPFYQRPEWLSSLLSSQLDAKPP